MVSGFWRFLAPFINVAKGVAVNSFISDDIGVSFIEIVCRGASCLQANDAEGRKTID